MARATMKIHKVTKKITFKRNNKAGHCPVCGKFYNVKS